MISKDTSPAELARLLGTTYRKLTYVLYAKHVSTLYYQFEITKKNGAKRTIRSPEPILKILQRRLKPLLEDMYKPHPAASAFIENRGIIYNARKHVKKAGVFNIDLEGFFDSINFGRVLGMLCTEPYNLKRNTAVLISHMCCVDQLLPQGAPTSPVISNMVCRSLDHHLSVLAKKNRAQYSRYADDITFSFITLGCNSICNENASDPKPKRELSLVIKRCGFKINPDKTRFQLYNEKQVVTGLKVNRKVNVDRRYVRTTRAMVHSLHLDVEGANNRYKKQKGDNVGRLENMVQGRINFIGMVKGKSSTVFQGLARKFNDLDVNLHISTEPTYVNRDIEQRLHFKSYESRLSLERSVWVISFEGVAGINDIDAQLVTGTAFCVGPGRLLTCAHVFSKAADSKKCVVYRISEPEKKYSANLVNANKTLDVAVIEVVGDELPIFKQLKVSKKLDVNTGYMLSLVGFSGLQPGHLSVSINPCVVINVFNKSTFKHYEIDKDIAGGGSGSPVLNAYMQVVGMAVMGKTVTFAGDGTDPLLEGTNSFISAKHLLEFI